MTKSKLPKICAMVGIVIGLGTMMMWWYINTFDPFHLPDAQTAGNYSAPRLYWFLEDITVALCPGWFLFWFADGTGGPFAWILSGIVALINGPIYYGIGLLIDKLMKRFHHLQPT